MYQVFIRALQDNQWKNIKAYRTRDLRKAIHSLEQWAMYFELTGKTGIGSILDLPIADNNCLYRITVNLDD